MLFLPLLYVLIPVRLLPILSLCPAICKLSVAGGAIPAKVCLPEASRTEPHNEKMRKYRQRAVSLQINTPPHTEPLNMIERDYFL